MGYCGLMGGGVPFRMAIVLLLVGGCGAPKQRGPGLQLSEGSDQIIPPECEAACPDGDCAGDSGGGPEHGVVGSGSCGLVTRVRHTGLRKSLRRARVDRDAVHLLGQVTEPEDDEGYGYGYEFEDDPLGSPQPPGSTPLALCIDLEGGALERAYTRDGPTAGTGGSVAGRIEAGRWYELMHGDTPSGYRFRIDGARFEVHYGEHQLVGGCQW